MLNRDSGEPFTTGVTVFEYRPATRGEQTNRVVLTIEIEGIQASAFVDTGGVHLICAPQLAARIGVRHNDGIEDVLVWRTIRLHGTLHRLRVTLPSVKGPGVSFEPTVFVPKAGDGQVWDDDLPCVMGMHNCLERLRFAIDPERLEFHFGSIGSD